jgi:MEMO1 family protein
MSPIREPAVAGSFYPRDPRDVAAQLDRLIPAVEARPARAVVVPHAGWKYSGAVAGETYAQVAVPRLAVLLGPNHTGRGVPGSVWSDGAWRYPGGAVPVASDLARAVLDACRDLQADEDAHRQEHALEVQVPFLHRRRPDLAVVPITLGWINPDFCRAVGEAIGRVVAGWPDPVLVVDSTDFNHYEPQDVARRKDGLAIEAILALDAPGLWRTVKANQISMCGIAPTQALLYAAPALGVRAARLVRHATSGDVSGDLTRVVGYAGLILE